MSVILTDENFKEKVSNAEKPVLVDFWMEGCGPCFLLFPILEKLAEEFLEKIIFAKVNLDAAPLVVQKYGINVAPTVILFKEGEPISGFIGLKPEEAIRAWLEESLLIREYQEYAKKSGFSLNPNHEMVEKLVKCMIERERRFGKRYCCCRRITNDLEEDKKIICPCIYVQKEIEEQGHCLCGLFVKNIIE